MSTTTAPAAFVSTLSALDERMMLCKPGGYPWDEWRARALAAGVGDQLA